MLVVLCSYMEIFDCRSMTTLDSISWFLLFRASMSWMVLRSLLSNEEASSLFPFKTWFNRSISWPAIWSLLSNSESFLLASDRSFSLRLRSSLSWLTLESCCSRVEYLTLHSWTMVVSLSVNLLLRVSISCCRFRYCPWEAFNYSTLPLRTLLSLSIYWVIKAILDS